MGTFLLYSVKVMQKMAFWIFLMFDVVFDEPGYANILENVFRYLKTIAVKQK